MGVSNSKSNLRNAIVHLTISAEQIRIDDEAFWNRFWCEDTIAANELFRSITVTEIRTLRDGSAENFATLCYKMVEKLHQSTATLCNTSGQQNAVLNSCKLLTRLIPCVFEDQDWKDFFFRNCLMTISDNVDNFKLIFPKKSDNERDYKSYLPSSIKANLSSDLQDDIDQVISEKILELDDEELSPSKNINNQMTEQRDVTLLAKEKNSLAKTLIKSASDLLFCPEFTVTTQSGAGNCGPTIDSPPEDLSSLETCEYIWEPGVGYYSYANSTNQYDKNRTELMRLLLTCFSSTIYINADQACKSSNNWINMFVTQENRHALPSFTSLINTICSYRPAKLLPFNHLLFEDTREELVQVALQVMIAVLDHECTSKDDSNSNNNDMNLSGKLSASNDEDLETENLFVEYMSRIHRDEDFIFILKGLTRLLNNPLIQTYLPSSTKRINFDQELLVLFWKICNFNRKFMLYVLKTSNVLEIVVPILYNLNENIMDASKSALIHIGVFNLLLLSGERNFGVRLNRSYSAKIVMDIPIFTGTHADLLVIVFHKLILFGQQNIRQLFDFLLTILLNISPYLKTLSMVSSQALVHLFEIFASPAIILTNPCYHQLVVLLLEIFNNLLQYQFDGNSNLIYSMIKKRQVFYSLVNLPTEQASIRKILDKLVQKKQKLLQLSLQTKSHGQHSEQQKEDKLSKQSERGTTIADLIPGSFDPNGPTEATISSGIAQFDLYAMGGKDNMIGSPRILQREISLVATPDIGCVTSQIHPNNSNDNDQTNQQQISSKSTLGSSFSTDSNLDNSTTNRLLTDQIEEVFQADTTIAKTASTKWQPTPDWVKSWKQTLPMHTTLRALQVLAPQIDRLKAEKRKDEESEILKFLQNGTLVGLLPVPHPITIRKYHTNRSTTLWFRTCTWGIIYLRNSMWLDTNVRLFKII